MDCAFNVIPKKLLPYSRSSRFSSTSFIVSHFTFRSVIHFEFIFVNGVKSVSRFIFLHVTVRLLQYHLLKRLFLLHCIAFVPLSKISSLYLYGSIFGFSILHENLFVYSFTNTTFFLLKILFYLFLERGKEGRKRKREASMWSCLLHILHWGPGQKPRHVPRLGIESVNLWFPGRHSIHRTTPARVNTTFL